MGVAPGDLSRLQHASEVAGTHAVRPNDREDVELDLFVMMELDIPKMLKLSVNVLARKNVINPI
jgi:hypothetical protein